MMAGAKAGKPDSKQGKQVIMLSVLGVAFLGAAIYGVTGSLSTPSAAPEPPAAVQAAQPTPGAEGAAPEGAAPAEVSVTVGGKPGSEAAAMQLPEISNSDPFKPTVAGKSNGGTTVAKPVERKAAEPQVKIAEAPRPAPVVSVSPAPAASSAQAPKVQLLPPPRPQVAVTGIIDAEGGADMALVDVDTEHRIIQIGDLLPGNYRVKRIAMDGVLLVSGNDRYFVALGNKAEGAAATGGAVASGGIAVPGGTAVPGATVPGGVVVPGGAVSY